MDFALTEEQERLRREVIAFAEDNLNDDVLRRDADHEFSRAAWKECANFGIQGLPVPEAYGGGDADPMTIAVVLEALGYACRDGGLLFSLNAQMWSCEVPLVRFGSDDQRDRYLPGLCDGSLIGVQAMTEPESGSDAFGLTTSARPTDSGYVLNGRKTFITNAPLADVFIVFASTDPSKGFAGLSAFVVERDAPGLAVGHPFRKMGLRTSPMSELYFDECGVDADAMIGGPGAGMAVFNSSMDWERSFILATAVGAMHRQLERTIAYARERQQFGQAIGKFQSVSNKIVDMKVRLETSRLLLYRLAWLRSRGKTPPLESAMVKLYLSEAFLQSSLDAVQVHGGYGYMEESELERDVRDALGGRIYSGTSEIQRNIVAGYLGL
jgi:alkylation response protein AidB-like acyl-CoA dehydrogenase